MLQNLPTDVSLNLLEENFIVKMFKPTTVRACDEYFTIVFAVVSFVVVKSMANIQGLELQGKIGLSKKSN